MEVQTHVGIRARGQALERPGDEAQQKAHSGRGWYAVLARTGLVAKGLSFGLVGALAIKLALGHGGRRRAGRARWSSSRISRSASSR